MELLKEAVRTLLYKDSEGDVQINTLSGLWETLQDFLRGVSPLILAEGYVAVFVDRQKRTTFSLPVVAWQSQPWCEGGATALVLNTRDGSIEPATKVDNFLGVFKEERGVAPKEHVVEILKEFLEGQDEG